MARRRPILVLLVLALAALALAGPVRADPALPPIHHVWIVMLENENGATSFGTTSPAPYLARALPAQGAYLPNVYGTGHASLDNYIALISGQGPNPVTQSDCQLYTDMFPGIAGPDGQVLGAGCVYPTIATTVANQLDAVGLSWRAYEEDMGNDPAREASSCAHPALNSRDPTQSASRGDEYAARHDPFVYFHSIIDSPICGQDVVPLTRLAGDLRAGTAAPSLGFITPNLCDDGHDSPCVDGRPGGLRSADAFLRSLIGQIEASPAYRDNGLIVVTFDEAASDGSSCCSEQSIDTPDAAGGNAEIGSGGGRVGAVLLSPFIRGGTIDTTPYNHYSTLRTIEDLFGLSHLGYADLPDPGSYSPAIFTASPPGSASAGAGAGGCTSTALAGRHGRVPAGTLIAAAVRRGRVLSVRGAHAARLHIGLRRGRRTLALRTRRLRACRSVRVVLPRGGGALTLTATVDGAREVRTLR